jgi:hypothetical protein
VLQNPAYQLALIEVPDLWSTLPRPAWAELAKTATCPVVFAEWVMRQREPGEMVLRAITKNAALPLPLRREALRQKTFDSFWSSHAMWEVPPAPEWEEVLTPGEWSLVLCLWDPAPEVWPVLTAADFETLVGLGEWGLGLAICHPDCPGPMVERVAELEEYSPYTSRGLRHPNLPAALLVSALASDDPETVSRARANPSIPAALLESLAQDPENGWKVASNASLPVAWMQRFARDLNKHARSNVALNRSLPPALVALLSDDPEPQVRKGIAVNSATPPAVRAKLAADPDRQVRSAAELRTRR